VVAQPNQSHSGAPDVSDEASGRERTGGPYADGIRRGGGSEAIRRLARAGDNDTEADKYSEDDKTSVQNREQVRP
jgi:hypothetical protein